MTESRRAPALPGGVRENTTGIIELFSDNHDSLARSMIGSTDECLRAASLRIDMLHNELIDKSELDESVEVRILTNKKGGKGPRKQFASAVMNELIRRTEGGVRADRLTHARMLISDDSELLVSSADLTRDQLIDEFNGGIYTKDPDAISDAIDAFDNIWENADPQNVGDQ